MALYMNQWLEPPDPLPDERFNSGNESDSFTGKWQCGEDNVFQAKVGNRTMSVQGLYRACVLVPGTYFSVPDGESITNTISKTSGYSFTEGVSISESVEVSAGFFGSGTSITISSDQSFSTSQDNSTTHEQSIETDSGEYATARPAYIYVVRQADTSTGLGKPSGTIVKLVEDNKNHTYFFMALYLGPGFITKYNSDLTTMKQFIWKLTHSWWDRWSYYGDTLDRNTY